jgi:hypothetical protein
VQLCTTLDDRQQQANRLARRRPRNVQLAAADRSQPAAADTAPVGRHGAPLKSEDAAGSSVNPRLLASRADGTDRAVDARAAGAFDLKLALMYQRR